MNKNSLLKTFSLLLTLTLTLSACGQLSPEKMQEFDRQRAEEEARNRPTPVIVISSLQLETTGTVDLQYSVTYAITTRTFSINVTRANGLVIARSIPLSSSDSAELYNTMLTVFGNSARITNRSVCPGCGPQSVGALVRTDQTAIELRNPLLIYSVVGATANFFDDLRIFISSRL